MKLIEGLKKIKYLEKKADDIKKLIALHCVDMDYESPVYPDQTKQVSEWIQSYSDMLKEMSNLHFRIQKTNIETKVTIELDGKAVQKSISEWIMRRRKLCQMEYGMYSSIGDKGLQEGQMRYTSGQSILAKVRRYYDPKARDIKMALLTSEPFEIDANLEIVNAVTDLVE